MNRYSIHVNGKVNKTSALLILLFLLTGFFTACSSPIQGPDEFIADRTDSSGLLLKEYVGYITVSGYNGPSTTVVIPDMFNGKNITKIDDSAFKNKVYLTHITLPANLTTIGNSAFYACTNLSGTLTLPDGLTSIGDSAFQNCSGFTGTLTLPKGLSSIGSAVFSGCSKLTGSLALPKGVTSIGDQAFYHCEGFTGSLSLPEGLISIGDQAFQYCYQFTGTLILPSSLTSIGDKGFSYCASLNLVQSLNPTPPSAGTVIFENDTLLTAIQVPLASIADYMVASGWSTYITKIQALK